MASLNASAKTSDVYYGALHLLHAGQYGPASRLLESIVNAGGDVDEDVTLNTLGTLYLKQGLNSQAIDLFKKAIEINSLPMYYSNLAQGWMRAYDPSKAVTWGLKGIKECGHTVPPDELLMSCASAHDMVGQPGEAYKYLSKLSSSSASNNVFKGMNLMASRDSFHEGLRLYASRHKGYEELLSKALYDSIRDRIVIGAYDLVHTSNPFDGYCNILLEQGLGDCVMMIPYMLKEATRRKHKVNIISIDGRHDTFVRDIASSYENSDNIRALCLKSFELPTLPGKFIWMFDLLAGGPTIKYGFIEINPQIKALASRYKNYIGICWKGNPVHYNDHWRSASLEAFRPIIENKYCVSLQQFTTPEEDKILDSPYVEKLPEGSGLITLAAVMANLSHVITVDTSISHLAGGLGTNCITLLPTNPDWRWGHGTECSRFYAHNHRLIRQTKCGDWSGPVEKALEIIG